MNDILRARVVWTISTFIVQFLAFTEGDAPPPMQAEKAFRTSLHTFPLMHEISACYTFKGVIRLRTASKTFTVAASIIPGTDLVLTCRRANCKEKNKINTSKVSK